MVFAGGFHDVGFERLWIGGFAFVNGGDFAVFHEDTAQFDDLAIADEDAGVVDEVGVAASLLSSREFCSSLSQRCYGPPMHPR